MLTFVIPFALLGLTDRPLSPQPVAPAEPTLEQPWKLPASLAAAAPEPTAFQDEEAVEEATEPAWTGTVALGGIISDGNTERRSVNFTADGELRREEDRTTLSAFFNYGQERAPGATNFTLNERRYGVKAQYDYFLSEKTYLLGSVRTEVDSVAMLDLRWIAGVGVGHQFKDEEDFKFAAEAGVSYVDEDFEVNSADKNYWGLRLAANTDYTISERWAVTNAIELYPSLEDSSDVYGKSTSQLTANLTERMIATLQWVWDWNNSPAPGAEKSDHRLQIGIGWSF